VPIRLFFQQARVYFTEIRKFPMYDHLFFSLLTSSFELSRIILIGFFHNNILRLFYLSCIPKRWVPHYSISSHFRKNSISSWPNKPLVLTTLFSPWQIKSETDLDLLTSGLSGKPALAIINGLQTVPQQSSFCVF